ncbi:BSD domain-containing protein 1 [Iris pallida]|uniref:BSD domain-containing protein 1 n=1 Tax=Iris pallida TaxID=29817 RepID=A0AAX6HCU5_IRIPA|nr:BSD domain-containing protein 1 [Iris pallida]
MDFFKSVFSTEEEEEREQEEEEEDEMEASPNPSPSEAAPSGSWSFGGLIKTFATRSESVIQSYRRDLEEFGSGLRKETEAIKEAASRVVGDLPGSLEAGASVAQESLETVGQALDEFGGTVWRGTAGIISHSREVLLADDSDVSPPDPVPSSSKRYSRFEAQVLAVQNDASTFVEEPEDSGDFGKWKLGFRLEEKEEEIEMLLYENGVLKGFYEKFVPGLADRDEFWSRYFYRVYKLQQAEEVRAKLVKRVISTEEEKEELSWDVDDEEEEEEVEEKKKKEIREVEEKLTEKEMVGMSESVEEKKYSEEVKMEEIIKTSEKPTEELSTKTEIVETSGPQEEKEPTNPSQVENLEEEEKSNPKTEDNKSPSDAKLEPAESPKDSDFSVISSQPSTQEDDDLGWDEIEDLDEHKDNKLEGSSGSPGKVDLRKRLSVAEDDEDLSWDIEDDEDEPTKT